MESKLRKRLQVLQEEYAKGKQALDNLESQANNLRDTLLRISGAVQVIQEELEEKPALGESRLEEEPVQGELRQASVAELS